MDIAKAIVTKIIKDGRVTLSQLETRSLERGLSLSDLYQALDKVHRDKRIKRGVRQGEVYYEVAKPKVIHDHLAWARNNYPAMTPDNDGSVIDIDLSYLFMSPDEAKEYKAAAKGVPTFMYNKRNAKEKRQITRE